MEDLIIENVRRVVLGQVIYGCWTPLFGLQQFFCRFLVDRPQMDFYRGSGGPIGRSELVLPGLRMYSLCEALNKAVQNLDAKVDRKAINS